MLVLASSARVKVGTALGELFEAAALWFLDTVRCWQKKRRRRLKTASDAYADAAEVVEASDVIFFTVPDGEISNAWKSLVASYGAAACDALFGKIVCHCSGALPAAVFADAAEYGAKAASVHPLFAISGGEALRRKSALRFSRLRATSRLLQRCRPCLTCAGFTIGKSLSSDKPLYHAAAVREHGCRLFSQAPKRCSNDVALAPTRLVVRCEHCLWATASQSPSAAPSTPLRGPSRRNDAETVVGHLMAFREDPTLLKERDAYTALSRVVVEVAAAKHPERDYSHIAEILRAAR